MESIDLGKSANQIWRESGSTLSFKTWLQREKDKGRFLPNKQLMEFNSFSSENEISDSRELIQKTLADNKTKSNTKDVTKGLSKAVLAVSFLLVAVGIGYKIYNKQSK